MFGLIIGLQVKFTNVESKVRPHRSVPSQHLGAQQLKTYHHNYACIPTKGSRTCSVMVSVLFNMSVGAQFRAALMPTACCPFVQADYICMSYCVNETIHHLNHLSSRPLLSISGACRGRACAARPHLLASTSGLLPR